MKHECDNYSALSYRTYFGSGINQDPNLVFDKKILTRVMLLDQTILYNFLWKILFPRAGPSL